MLRLLASHRENLGYDLSFLCTQHSRRDAGTEVEPTKARGIGLTGLRVFDAAV